MTTLIPAAPYGWMNLPFGATSPFPYSPSRPHAGRDWGYYYANEKQSRRVVAPIGGVVESVYSLGGNNSGWGNRVVIRVNSRVKSALNHLATGTIAVKAGQTITAGTYIGQMGNTGETYGQIHLHEELYVDGVRVNPDYYRTHDVPGTEGSGAGGGGTPFPGKDDMTPEQDALLRNIAAFLYGGGADAANPNYLGMPGTVYNLLKTPVARTVGGKTVQIPQIQDNADTNTMVRQLLATGGITDAQVKAIAEAVIAAIGTPEVEIDLEAIATAVRTKFSTDPLK